MPIRSRDTISGTLAVLLVLLLAVGGLLLVPIAPGGAGALARPSISSSVSVPVDTISIGNQTGGNLPPIWGADLRPEYAVGGGLTSEIQGTPIDYFRWPGGALADRFNMSTGVTYAPSSVAPTNESDFVNWCRSVDCHAILQVPGEVNSPSMAAWEVAYTEQHLGFYPDYWEIGNEPGLWTHFNIPWTRWSSSHSSTVDPQTYATVVHRYIAAMRAVDPTIKIVGLPGVGLGAYSEAQWIASTVAQNGPNLSAVAIHVYPAGTGPAKPTLSQFFASLTGKTSIPVRVAADWQAIKTACPECGPIAVFVTELGSGSSGGGSWGAYMAGYPNAPYIAAELSQAVANNVSSTYLFTLRGTYGGSIYNKAGTPQPVDQLYADLLPHLGPRTLATDVGGPVNGVYAIGSEAANGSSVAVMVVNANTTASVALHLGGPGFPGSGSYSVWWWNSSTPTVHSGNVTGNAPTWKLPPLGLLVISVERPVTRGGGGPTQYPVTFRETGLPVGTAWSVNLTGPVFVAGSSSSTEVSFEELNGSYEFTVDNFTKFQPAPAGGSFVVDGSAVVERIGFVAAPSGNRTLNETVTFVENGLPTGTTWGIAMGNGNLSSRNSSFVVSEPNGSYGYTLTGVPGWAPSQGLGGRFTVSGVPKEIVVPFVRGVAATFVTDGIGGSSSSVVPSTGAAWLLGIDNATLSVDSGNLTVYLPPGSYAFTVTPPAGYVAFSTAGDVAVSAAPARIVTEFTPASSVLFAWFNETGLPTGTPWSVTIAGFTVPSLSSTLALNVTSGENYSFRIEVPSGYSAVPSSGLFTVAGRDLTVPVAFLLPVSSHASPPFPAGTLLPSGIVIGMLLALVAAALNRKRQPPGDGGDHPGPEPRGFRARAFPRFRRWVVPLRRVWSSHRKGRARAGSFRPSPKGVTRSGTAGFDDRSWGRRIARAGGIARRVRRRSGRRPAPRR